MYFPRHILVLSSWRCWFYVKRFIHYQKTNLIYERLYFLKVVIVHESRVSSFFFFLVASTRGDDVRKVLGVTRWRYESMMSVFSMKRGPMTLWVWEGEWWHNEYGYKQRDVHSLYLCPEGSRFACNMLYYGRWVSDADSLSPMLTRGILFLLPVCLF